VHSIIGNGLHLKNSDPGKADVIERDGSLKRVVADRATAGVELIPVDALARRRRSVVRRPVARSTGNRVRVGGQICAHGHAVVVRLAADEVPPAAVVIRRQVQPGNNERCS